MPLTQARKKEFWNLLEQTGGHKESLLRRRKVPREYQAFRSQCVREERELFFPGLSLVRVILPRANVLFTTATTPWDFETECGSPSRLTRTVLTVSLFG